MRPKHLKHQLTTTFPFNIFNHSVYHLSATSLTQISSPFPWLSPHLTSPSTWLPPPRLRSLLIFIDYLQIQPAHPLDCHLDSDLFSFTLNISTSHQITHLTATSSTQISSPFHWLFQHLTGPFTWLPPSRLRSLLFFIDYLQIQPAHPLDCHPLDSTQIPCPFHWLSPHLINTLTWIVPFTPLCVLQPSQNIWLKIVRK